MRVAICTLFLALSFTSAKAQFLCDIAQQGLEIRNAGNTANVSTICVGQHANFRFTIFNNGSNNSCIIPAGTVTVNLSFPEIAPGVRPYIYAGPASFSSGIFTWTYNAGAEILQGVNTLDIPRSGGDADILVDVIGNAPGGVGSSILNIIQNGGVSNNPTNDNSSAQLTVTAAPATPTISAGGPLTFCAGGSVTLTASTGSSHIWSNGETTQSIIVTSSGNYSVQVTNAAGCLSAASAATTVTVNPIPATPTISTSGPTTFCAGGSVTLTSSSATGNLWSPGEETTQSIVVTTAGSYSVQVTSIGCTSAASAPTVVTVNPVPASPTISAGGPLTFCTGSSVTLTSSSATGNLWSPGGETTQSIIVTTSGSYTVQVTAAGCTSSASAATVVTVNPIPATPTITAGSATTFCAGGSVTLTSSSATGNVWSPGGETTQAINVTSSGSYSVQVTTAGCTSAASAPTVVTVNPIPATPTIGASGPLTFCTGGSVTLTSSSATGNLWSPGGETTQSIIVTTSGSYTVQVTAAGCTSSASAVTVVTVNPIPATPTITAGSATTFCAGGSVTLTSSSATGNIWSPGGATTQAINVTASGSYTVQVTAAGCTSAASAPTVVTVNPIPPTPTIGASGPLTFCTGGSVTLTSSSATGNLWSPGGETTQSIIVTTSGSYTVQVTAVGCTSAASAATVVTVNPLPSTPTISAGGPTTFCAGGNVTLTSSAGSGYLWSTGATTQSIVASTAGNYTVQVTNAAGCQSAPSAATTVTVNALPATPTISAGGPTTFCTGGNVTLTASTATGYLWSTGATTQSILVSASGNYTVQVTNGAGCLSAPSAATTVTVNGLPASPTHTIDCTLGFSNAVITVTGPLGAGLEYRLDAGAYQPGLTFSGVSNGSHTITVKTVSGCTTTGASFSVSCGCVNGPALTLSSTTGSTCSTTAPVTVSGNTFSNATQVTITENGAGTVSPGNTGTSPFSFTYTPAPADAGNTVTITVSTDNPLGAPCAAATATYTLTVNTTPATPTITPGGATTFCAGGNVTLTATAGAGYLWSTGATTQSIVVSTAGNYTVQVSNAAGCLSAASAETTVTVNPVPATPVITPGGPTTFCAGGSVTLTSSSATGNTWSPGGATTPSINVTTSGTYTVQVTALGCTSAASAPVSVTVNPIPATPTITAGGATTFCAGGSVTLTSSSATGNVWTPGGATTQSIIVTASGSYTVQVTALGCTSAASAPTVVTVNPVPPTPVITPGGSTTFCAGGSVTLTSSSATGNIWTPGGATTQSINVTATGTYTVQVSSLGCTSAASAPVAVTVNPIPATPTITPGGPTTFCAGGSVTLTSSSATGNVWTPGGATTQSINVNTSGSYTVQVTSLGCTSAASAPTVVTVNSLPATPTQTIDCSLGFGNGIVTVTGPLGAGLEYRLDAGPYQTGLTFNGVSNGTHTITVKNAAGCTMTGPLFTVACGCLNAPTLTLSSNTGSTCGLTPVTISGNTFSNATNVTITENGAGTVSPGNTGTSPFSFTYTPAAGDAGNTVTITVSTNNPSGAPCAAATATYTLAVNATPVVTCPAPFTVCSSAAAFTLSGGSPAGGTYSGAGVSGGNFDPAAAGVGDHTIIYSYTDINGCSSSCSFTITVVTARTEAATCPANLTVCTNTTPFALTGGSPAGGTYSGPGVSGGIFTPATAGIGTHTITYSQGGGCTSSCTFTITVTVGVPASCPANMSVCSNTTPFTLTGGSPAGGTYSGPGVSGGIFNPAVAGTGLHTITYSQGTFCASSCTFFINVTAAIPAICPANLTVCNTTTAFALTGGSPAGGTYSGPGVNAGNFDPAAAGLGTHTITYSQPGSCGGICTFTITVNSGTAVSCPANLIVCNSTAPFTLTGGSPAGGTYSGPGVSGGIFNPGTAGAGLHTITYSQAGGCASSCTFTIRVNNVTGNVSGTTLVPQNPAANSVVTFSASGGQANYTFSYTISVNGGPAGPVQTIATSGSNSVTVLQSNAISGTYAYTLLAITDANGCTGNIPSPATATVSVVTGAPLPSPDMTGSQFFTSLQIAAGGTIDELIVLRNVGSGPTTGPIVFSVTNYSALTGLSATSHPNPTMTIGFTTYTLDNANWTFTSSPSSLVFTSNPGVVIPVGGAINIGVRITRVAGANGTVTQTLTIVPGTGGGESPSTNNTINNTILKN